MGIKEIDLTEVKNSEENKLAEEIEGYYKQDMSDKLLRAYSWDEAVRFYDGDQHIEYNVSLNRFQQVTITRNNDFIPRPITNYIVNSVKTVVSQLTKQKPQAKVRPNSQSPKDIAAAKVADLILDVKHEELREDEKTQEKAYWGVICGTVWKKIFWNESTTKVIRLPRMENVVENVLDEEGKPSLSLDSDGQPNINEDGSSQYQTQNVERQAIDEKGEKAFDEYDVGDVDDSIIPPFNIAVPMQARSPLEMEWIMEYSVQKLEWIKRVYSKKGDGYTGEAVNVTEEKDLSTVMQLEYRLRTLTGRRSGGQYSTGSAGFIDLKNSAVLKEYYGKPTKKYPKGRMVVVANGKTLFAGDSPYHEDGYSDSWNPYVDWRFELVPGRIWGKGLVEEMIPLNRRINAIDSLIILNRRTMAIPQWLIPEGSGVPNGYINGRPGLNIPYRPVGANGAKPEKIKAESLPQQVILEREQAVKDLKRLGMTQDVLEGTNPQGVKTAYQLEQLLENALAAMGATFQRWEKSIEREETKKLLLISKRYKEPRPEFGKKLKAINKDVTDIELDMFMGEDLKDNVNVRIETNSSIPRSKAGENAVIRELVQGKVIDVATNPVNKREFLDKMGVKGFDYESSPDVKRAQWENSIIEEGDMQNLIVKPAGQEIDPVTRLPIETPPETVLELDDNTTHIIIHSARAKDPNVPQDIRQKYLVHIDEHLRNEAEGLQAQQAAAIQEPGEVPIQKTNQEQAPIAAEGGV